jgi:hypothetical protein
MVLALVGGKWKRSSIARFRFGNVTSYDIFYYVAGYVRQSLRQIGNYLLPLTKP